MDIRKSLKQLNESEWLLGILLNGYEDLKKDRIQWINNGKYTNKWFADPFILDFDNEKIILLVEEFDYKIHRGRLARLIIDKNSWTITDCKIILDLDTHLSFPMIWREDGKVYICPENYASGALNIYQYDTTVDSLTFIKRLVEGKLTDATLFKCKDSYYILSTNEPTPNGNKLPIYISDSLLGEYTKCQDIVFDENIARNAGMIFMNNGELIRPSQECNNTYGHAISFQRISIENGQFSFAEDYRYTSTNRSYSTGAHTYNQYNNLGVIDVKGYRYKVLGRLLSFVFGVFVILHIKKKIHLT